MLYNYSNLNKMCILLTRYFTKKLFKFMSLKFL